MDSRGEGKVPRLFGETANGIEVNSCLQFDHLYTETGIETVQQIAHTRKNTGSTVGGSRSDDEQGTRGGGTPGQEQTPPVADDTKL